MLLTEVLQKNYTELEFLSYLECFTVNETNIQRSTSNYVKSVNKVLFCIISLKITISISTRIPTVIRHTITVQSHLLTN